MVTGGGPGPGKSHDAERQELIRELREIVERERPWIELFHREDYALYHDWLHYVKPFGMSYPMLKYRDIDAAARLEKRAQRNDPVVWPAWALAGITVAIVIPGIVTFFRERQ